jgi:hypothetical protein
VSSASRRTVDGALLLPVVALSATPGQSGWTNSQVAASSLLAALRLTFRGMENRSGHWPVCVMSIGKRSGRREREDVSTVIASAAKQSIVPRNKNGLLRRKCSSQCRFR